MGRVGVGVAAVALVAIGVALSGGDDAQTNDGPDEGPVVERPTTDDPDPPQGDPPGADDSEDPSETTDPPAPTVGVVRVAGSLPAGARVFVSGDTTLEGAPGGFTLAAGEYRFEVRADGLGARRNPRGGKGVKSLD